MRALCSPHHPLKSAIFYRSLRHRKPEDLTLFNILIAEKNCSLSLWFIKITVDDHDTDADLVAGFDDNGDSADEYTDAPAGNTAADGACDGDDSNGEGKTNDKGDCDIDCNRAEYWRKNIVKIKTDAMVRHDEF